MLFGTTRKSALSKLILTIMHAFYKVVLSLNFRSFSVFVRTYIRKHIWGTMGIIVKLSWVSVLTHGYTFGYPCKNRTMDSSTRACSGRGETPVLSACCTTCSWRNKTPGVVPNAYALPDITAKVGVKVEIYVE